MHDIIAVLSELSVLNLRAAVQLLGHLDSYLPLFFCKTLNEMSGSVNLHDGLRVRKVKIGHELSVGDLKLVKIINCQ